MGLSTADFTENIIDEFGESAVLCGDHFRQTITVVFTPEWGPASAGGIGIERMEPYAQLRTTDADLYGADNGWTLEVGSYTYRISARADDGYGLTTLTLAKT
jgi:hypothetical protein